MGVLYISLNIENLLKDIAANATNINDIITKLYYPAGVYNNLLTKFNIKELFIFIIVNILLLILSIKIISNVYFKINSNVKRVITSSNKKDYRIENHKVIPALMKKEFIRFINSPVFIINAAFGLVLYVALAIGLVLKFDTLETGIMIEGQLISLDIITSYFPVMMFLLVCATSFMSSITSSMISLEGKSFSILKSLPISSLTIILAKVFSAIVIMVPFILIGNIIILIKFKLSIIETIIIIISSVVLPMVSSIMGIIINLKYPKMDAENDTEVVKQSMSSMIAVFGGMGVIAITGFIVAKLIQHNVSNLKILIGSLSVYLIILGILMLYLKNHSTKDFEAINV